jgi:SnoaL-like domain
MTPDAAAADVSELTRRAYESLNSRDFDAVVSLFGPSSIWDVSRWGLGAHTGPEAIRRFLEDWFGSFDKYEVHIENMLDLGHGVIYAMVVFIAHRPGSRDYLRLPSVAVFAWVEGVVARVTLYPDVNEGRGAADRMAESMGK